MIPLYGAWGHFPINHLPLSYHWNLHNNYLAIFKVILDQKIQLFGKGMDPDY